MLNRIFNQVNILEKGLDASWKKNEVIANNIANVDTAGFKASHVEFESVFRDTLGTDSDSFFSNDSTNSNAFQSRELIQQFNNGTADKSNVTSSGQNNIDNLSKINIIQDGNISQVNGNSVDIDSEMSELAKNAILYDTITYSMNKELGRLKTIINEGR